MADKSIPLSSPKAWSGSIDLTFTTNVSLNSTTVKVVVYDWKTDSYISSCGQLFRGTLTIGSNKYSFTFDETYPYATERIVKEVTVNHDSSGNASLYVACSIQAPYSSGWGLSGAALSGSETVSLPKINTEPTYSASTLTDATDTNLGNFCEIKFTPGSNKLYYKVTFKIGSKTQKTSGIYPNTTGSYSYQILLPQSLASEIPGTSKTARCTVELTTHTASSCTSANQVGSKSTKTITVTVVEDSETRPVVSAAVLQPSPDLLDGLYIQAATGVKATAITASGKYNATISRTYFRVEGKDYNLNTQSDYLAGSGSITVTAYAVDSRGFTSAGFQVTIQSQPYSKPKLKPISGRTRISVIRCNSNGVENDSGAYLKILVKREYSKLVVGGQQHNFCKIQFRYKLASGTGWSNYTVILAENAGSDEVTTGPLVGTLSPTSSYQVEITAIDTVGSTGSSVIEVSSEDIYWHRNGARGSLAFGKYVEEDDVFDIASNKTLIIRGGLVLSGDAALVFLDAAHPIGSILETVRQDDPGEYLGGTWVELEDTGTTVKWRRTD